MNFMHGVWQDRYLGWFFKILKNALFQFSVSRFFSEENRNTQDNIKAEILIACAEKLKEDGYNIKDVYKILNQVPEKDRSSRYLPCNENNK